MEKEKADSCELSTDQLLFYFPPHFPRVPKMFINYRTHHPLGSGISSLLAAILAGGGAKMMMLSMSLEHLEAACRAPDCISHSQGSSYYHIHRSGNGFEIVLTSPFSGSSLSKWLPELPTTYGQYFPPLSKSCHLSLTQSMRSSQQKPSLGHRPGALGVVEQCFSNAFK